MRILVDLDSCVVDLLSVWVNVWNAIHQDKLRIENITDWNIHQFITPGLPEAMLYKIIELPGFFEHLKPFDGAVDGVRALHSMGHDIAVATAVAHPSGVAEKLTWIRRYLSFLHKENFFICHHKEWIKADAIIDDSPIQLRKYHDAWPDAQLHALAWPYNVKVPSRVVRHEGWDKPAEAWKSIVAAFEVPPVPLQTEEAR